MKLVARLLGEHPQLVEQLKQKGWRVKHVRGAVVADLRPDPKRTNFYLFPPGLDAAEVLIEVAEKGGAGAHNGQAIVVCGLSGKKMRPYFRPTEGDVQAYFAVPFGVVDVTVTQLEGRPLEIEAQELTIARNEEGVLLQRRQLDQHPQGSWGKFNAAVDAAVQKARCRGCRHVHYGE